MQGRLSPPVNGKIQAFPAACWRDEFPRARMIGLISIEWIVESPVAENPIWCEPGLDEIRGQIVATDVAVDFICADIFMETAWAGIHAGRPGENRKILNHIIDQAAKLGAVGIEIPCVDASELRSQRDEDELLSGIEPCLDLAGESGIQIGLETSLPPERFRQLLDRCGHPTIRANYDTGNSASLGYNCREEIDAYGAWINNVHIKDRQYRGATVPLGTGQADIPSVLEALHSRGYRGGFILQAARQGEELSTVRLYHEWLQNCLGRIADGGNGHCAQRPLRTV